MAKTRIKNTPTRLQKDALMMTNSTTMAQTIITGNDVKRLNTPQLGLVLNKAEDLHATSTIIVPAPKRTSSISSSTSTMSRSSDTPSAHSSDAESPPPPSTATTVSNLPPRTLNSMLNNGNAASSLKNRKVFMITERSDDNYVGESGVATGQKRKMYLIMEENNSPLDSDSEMHSDGRTQDGIGPPKKLTLVTDKCDGEMTQKFEKILPEILNRIQGRGLAIKKENDIEYSEEQIVETTVRQPITLPPKKNRSKIAIQSSNGQLNLNTNGNKQQQASVIVSAASLNNNTIKSLNNAPSETVEQNIMPDSGQIQSNGLKVAQRNINLSTDFLFLMKILPKLESIPEPHKNHVKDCIEKIVNQNASLFDK